MGGDGGTVSTNRTYLRGAGKACHTADHPSNALKRSKLEDAERAQLVLVTCAATGTLLDLSPAKNKNGGGASVSGADIVACPHGKLYKREKALEALLRRGRHAEGGNGHALGSHIRGMKDLHPVRFHVIPTSKQGGTSGYGAGRKYVAACPITGSEIGGGNVPSFVIVRAKSRDRKRADGDDEASRNPNVLSERAIKEMGFSGLQAEYGPFEEKDMIRLAPPMTGGVFEGIQRRWEERMENERAAKMKKKDKKRKRGEIEKPRKLVAQSASSAKQSESRPIKGDLSEGRTGVSMKSAADEARFAVQSAVARNAVLSGLFGAGKKNGQSEKEKRDGLFTRNC